MKDKIKRNAIILCSLNFALTFYIVYSILAGDEPDWPMLWILLILPNLHILLLCKLTSWLIFPFFETIALRFSSGTPLSDPENFWEILFYFGILGTVIWYYIPFWCVKIFNRIADKIDRKK